MKSRTLIIIIVICCILLVILYTEPYNQVSCCCYGSVQNSCLCWGFVDCNKEACKNMDEIVPISCGRWINCTAYKEGRVEIWHSNPETDFKAELVK